jgi:signal transduction histidine kinase
MGIWRPSDSSLSQKLIALIAVLMTVVVGVLTAYFPSRERAAQRRQLINRADIYGALVSDQLSPAIAFRDRVTAREVLGSLSIDPEIRSAVVCTSDGVVLYATPSAAPNACATALAGDSRTIQADDERVTVIAPIVTREGPRGTVIIEFSTARLRSGSRTEAITATAVGGLVLAGGVTVAYLLARSLAKRLRRIADVASAVTAGDLDHQPVLDSSPDELGTLARAFNAMLAQMRHLLTAVQELAHREQETLADANRTLERRVGERTSELRMANEHLKAEMTQRSQIEIELRQAQKLESVGRLAAGIAHEINTPIQFVNDSVHFARSAIEDLLPVIASLQAVRAAVVEGRPDIAAAAAAKAQEAEENADLAYLFSNLPPALDRALEGLNRVTNIVRSMKEFAHPDQKEMTSVDLNRAIESTLTISRNEYKHVAELEMELGDIPRVICHAGEVNQAVLNIVVNAAHAIADMVKGTDHKGRISVQTTRDGDDVVIRITDTGGGIPAPIQDRIFDPFFTTKEVGRGTGQGLSISRSVIVDKHHGDLQFETVVGKGTTFYIRLPIDGPAPARAAAVAAT